jgi:hypothetical protein
MDKKLQAAIAGVIAYLGEEAASVPVSTPKPSIGLKPWTLNGIQTIMQNRALVQRRVIKR